MKHVLSKYLKHVKLIYTKQRNYVFVWKNKQKLRTHMLLRHVFFFFRDSFLLASVLIGFRFSLSGGNVLCYVEK